MAIADSVRLMWPSKINSVEKSKLNINNWLTSSTSYTVSQVNKGSVDIIVGDYDEFVSVLSQDSIKFAIASIETAANIQQHHILRKSLAWPMVQSYYSGFYAAHSLLRLTGSSCSRIDGVSISKIHSIARASGTLSNFSSSGYYYVNFNSAKGELKLQKKPEGLGTHQFLWVQWVDRLKNLINLVNLSTTIVTSEKAAIVDRFNNIISVHQNLSSNDVWLSDVRNSINYAMDFSVWYPYKNRARYYESLPLLLDSWSNSSDSLHFDISHIRSQPLQASTQTQVHLVSILKDSILDLDNRLTIKRNKHAVAQVISLLNILER